MYNTGLSAALQFMNDKRELDQTKYLFATAVNQRSTAATYVVTTPAAGMTAPL